MSTAVNGRKKCHWCGVDLSFATRVSTYNGNLPVCDLCILRATSSLQSLPLRPLEGKIVPEREIMCISAIKAIIPKTEESFTLEGAARMFTQLTYLINSYEKE